MNLRDLRKQAKMTAKEVADKLGVSERSIHRYEDGTRSPDIITAYKLSKIYDITLSEFVEYYVNNRTILLDNPQ